LPEVQFREVILAGALTRKRGSYVTERNPSIAKKKKTGRIKKRDGHVSVQRNDRYQRGASKKEMRGSKKKKGQRWEAGIKTRGWRRKKGLDAKTGGWQRGVAKGAIV